ncbi:hypothetical protein BO86DRAFT_400354 [Aspergillus japonicus CBS 114.51]|uniref:Uncharacterized protein n=1 Tax=Aspergillus japonicus CBS 114.51 TaxID=1448312 RepID=A0A8T8WZ01_ASPJA|nr:hypothetical protein BO86DRAFT_400354 [Aspergillus japonicus CBS 114.51]RAH80904.1 hypothetical protein BO86DRAFT_400354 [Aspergillus japonicus CBS 114.51]
MYTETASSRFLVLAPIHNGPLTATSAQHPRERSSSQSSTTSNDSSRRPGIARLPSGFLYLGHDGSNRPRHRHPNRRGSSL